MTSISRVQIIKQAESIKQYVEKNKQLPKSYKINDVSLSNEDMLYLLNSFLIQLNLTNISSVKIKAASNSTHDVINENVYEADFKDMAKRVQSYLKTNKQVPSYVTTKKSKKKVDWKLYLFCVAKIITFYNKNSKTLPKYCLFNTKDLTVTKTTTKTTNSNVYVSTPHILTTGCNNLGQCTGYYCGPHSLMQCIYKLTGKKIKESTLASWAGTTTNGTGHSGLETALAKFNKTYGYNLKITWKNFSDLGATDAKRAIALGKLMNKNDTAIFWHEKYRYGEQNNGQGYGHYSLANKYNKSTLIFSVMNSLGNKCNAPAYCGYIESRSLAKQKKYWAAISQKSIAIITK